MRFRTSAWAMKSSSALKRLIILACGTSWHAGLVGKFYVENLARLNTEVDLGSEFRYRDPLVGPEDLVLSVSQSGETADTLAAVKEAKSKGATALAICNVVGSTLTRESQGVIYTHAGPEIGVGLHQGLHHPRSARFICWPFRLGRARGVLDDRTSMELVEDLVHLPALVQEEPGGRRSRLKTWLKNISRPLIFCSWAGATAIP